ncbi:MAG: pimeloyl-ACP methyl ester esterase BioH [Pseudomonadota bacterium]|nr:pimeloyl-ACP methyl ester esterase BioH [Pseudomonadota bacterium]
MSLYTYTVGEGPDVVLAHGWGMHSGVWEDVVEGLVDHYRVTVLDLPGHGYSAPLPVAEVSPLEKKGAGEISRWATAALAATPAPATWIGWSLGGLVAQQVALTMPERVSRLVLVNSTPCFVQRPDWPYGQALAVLRRFAEELRQDYRAVLKRFIALEVHGSEHASAQLKQLKAMLFQHGEPAVAALQEGLAILETADLRTQWPQIQCPVLMMMGQRDQLVPSGAGEAMLPSLPNARLHVFPRAGHAPFFSHLPEFLAELRAFLDESSFLP